MAKDIHVNARLSEPIKASAGLGQTVVVGGTVYVLPQHLLLVESSWAKICR